MSSSKSPQAPAKLEKKIGASVTEVIKKVKEVVGIVCVANADSILDPNK